MSSLVDHIWSRDLSHADVYTPASSTSTLYVSSPIKLEVSLFPPGQRHLWDMNCTVYKDLAYYRDPLLWEQSLCLYIQ